MRFLVTGGAGFIGSHLIENLLADHHEVTVIDNLSTGKLQNLTKLDNPKLSFLQKSILTDGLTNCPPELMGQYDGLVHLAATPSVTQSWFEPLAAHENNVSATVAVIQWCHQLKIPRLVFASSAAVYGHPRDPLISESAPTQPISPYGLQKLVSEQYIALFSKQFGISSVNLRLFNVFGAGQDPNSPYSGVISIFTKRMGAGKPLTLYGDGTQTRDFIYVKDVATAFKQALTQPIQDGSSLTCNIGTGRAISLLQLVDALKTCFPQWSEIIHFEPTRLGDIQHSQADVTQAALQLNFTPQWSLQSGLMALVNAQL